MRASEARDTDATETDAIVRALKAPFWRVSLPAPLERRYEAATVRRRNRFLAGWMAVNLVMNLLYLGAELARGVSAALALTHGAVTLVVGIAVIVLALQPAAWLASVLVISAHDLDSTMATWTGMHSPMPFADHAISNTGFIMLAVLLTSPLRLRDAAILSVVSIASYAWLLLGPLDPLPTFEFDNVLHTVLLAMVALAVVQGRERSARNAFLLSELNEIRLQELAALSETDALTGLPNRRAFDGALEAQWGITRQTGEMLGLLMIDIDNFKKLNDLRGHAEGDRCLREVAALLRAGLRPGTDMIARFGGEEFAVVLRDIDRATVVEVGERLRAQVERAVLPHPSAGLVTVSVGAAVARPAAGAGGAEALLVAADNALYTAKQSGRNRVARAEVAAAG